MFAVLDESTPPGRNGLHYVIAAAVIIDGDLTSVSAKAQKVLQHRRNGRPFHWSNERPPVREAMLSLLADELEIAVVASWQYPTGRRRQERAREAALTVVVPKLGRHGVDDLYIESRAEQDRADHQALLRLRHAGFTVPRYSFRGKDLPAMWLGDAVVGAVSEHVSGRGSEAWGRLSRSCALVELEQVIVA